MTFKGSFETAPQLLWSQTFLFSYETISFHIQYMLHPEFNSHRIRFCQAHLLFFMIFHSLMGTYIDLAMNFVYMFASMAILSSLAGKLLYGALSSVVKVNLQITFILENDKI